MMTRHKKMILAIAIVLGGATVAGAGIGLLAGETVNNANTVGKDSAKEIALAHAGFSESEVTLKKVELDRDDGRIEYEVEFRKDGVKYEYEIDAESGQIIAYDQDVKNSIATEVDGTPTVITTITADEAKAKVLAHAGLNEAEVTFTKVKLDRDDGGDEYDIEFYKENVKYEYDIDAISGEIRSYDSEIKKKAETKPVVNVQPVTPTTEVTGSVSAPVNELSADEAKAIALAHAGLAEADVRITKVKLDHDDGRKEYEIEFVQGQIEYEYDIDAQSGEILDFEKDYDD